MQWNCNRQTLRHTEIRLWDDYNRQVCKHVNMIYLCVIAASFYWYMLKFFSSYVEKCRKSFLAWSITQQYHAGARKTIAMAEDVSIHTKCLRVKLWTRSIHWNKNLKFILWANNLRQVTLCWLNPSLSHQPKQYLYYKSFLTITLSAISDLKQYKPTDQHCGTCTLLSAHTQAQSRYLDLNIANLKRCTFSCSDFQQRNN